MRIPARTWGLAALIAGSLCVSAGRAAPAQPGADPLSSAEKSVVRIVVLSLDSEGELADADLGSGFVVAPGRVITNHHVVAGAADAASVRVFVIPERESGSGHIEGRIVGDWAGPDLALIEAPALKAPPLTITTTIPAKNASIHALGYPSITDAMRRLSVEEILSPAEPYVTPGSVALLSATAPGGARVESIFHTAPINGGNSGGPLLDACGRVIGVNAAVGASSLDSDGAVTTVQGQSVAISGSVLARVLAQYGVSTEAGPCVPPAEAAVETRLTGLESALAHQTRVLERTVQLTEAQGRQRDKDLRLMAAAFGALVLMNVMVLLVVLLRRRPAAAPGAGAVGAEQDGREDLKVSA